MAGTPKRLRAIVAVTGSLAASAGLFAYVGLSEARAEDDKPVQAARLVPRDLNANRKALTAIHEQLADLAAKALEGIDLSVPTEADLAAQKMRVDVAKSAHERAAVAREAAEFALRDYKDRVAPGEKKAREADIAKAKLDLARAEQAIPLARERYERFKHVKTGSAADLSRQWRLEAGETDAQLIRKRAQLGLEQAEGEQKIFLEFKNLATIKELLSQVEYARSDELAREASWRLQVGMLIKFERMRNPKARPLPIKDQQKLALELLAQAIPLEERLSTRLDQIKDDNAANEADRKEIADLTEHLKRIVERAHDATQASAIIQLRAKLRRAAP